VTHRYATHRSQLINYLLPSAKDFTKFDIRTVVKTVVRHKQRGILDCTFGVITVSSTHTDAARTAK
jgi:hypothetical protein